MAATLRVLKQIGFSDDYRYSMTYIDLLNIAGNLMSFDGWIVAAYMFLNGLSAAILNLKPERGKFFLYGFLGLLLALLAPSYSNVVVEARFPYVFIFCFGIVGIGLALAGFLAICFSPAIFAFLSNMKGRRAWLLANIPLVFPFGPVILFFFVLKDYRQAIATTTGDLVQTI